MTTYKTAPKNNLKENKPQPSLIPMDLLIGTLDVAYMEGIAKYYRESWRLGFPTSVMFDSALRHLNAYFYEKEDYDPDAEKIGIKKLHLAGVLFSVICMIDTLLNHPEMDDRGKDYSPKQEQLKKFNFSLDDLPSNISQLLINKEKNYTSASMIFTDKHGNEIKG